MYTVYILFSAKLDKYYIGFTSDINQRIVKHNRKSKGFTELGRPWIIVFTETYQTKKEAMQRESQLKKWKNRERLEDLIKAGSEHPD